MHNTRKRAAGDVTMPSDYDYVCSDYAWNVWRLSLMKNKRQINI